MISCALPPGHTTAIEKGCKKKKKKTHKRRAAKYARKYLFFTTLLLRVLHSFHFASAVQPFLCALFTASSHWTASSLHTIELHRHARAGSFLEENSNNNKNVKLAV
jgi:hypothetical protein